MKNYDQIWLWPADPNAAVRLISKEEADIVLMSGETGGFIEFGLSETNFRDFTKHRLDGPAVIYLRSRKECYYIAGSFCTYQEWKDVVQ